MQNIKKAVQVSHALILVNLDIELAIPKTYVPEFTYNIMFSAITAHAYDKPIIVVPATRKKALEKTYPSDFVDILTIVPKQCYSDINNLAMRISNLTGMPFNSLDLLFGGISNQGGVEELAYRACEQYEGPEFTPGNSPLANPQARHGIVFPDLLYRLRS